MLQVIGKSDKQASGKEMNDTRNEQGKAPVRYAEAGGETSIESSLRSGQAVGHKYVLLRRVTGPYFPSSPRRKML